MPLYLWGKLASAGKSGWDIGRQRAARETGSFSYRNATIIEHAGHASGSLIGYVIPEVVEPVRSDMPAMFVPLQELENLAPGTWYVNVLAVLPPYRSLGLGTSPHPTAGSRSRAACVDEAGRVRVFFVNRYFYPDHSATSQMLTDLAFALADRGHRITVVTSRLSYDDPASAIAT